MIGGNRIRIAFEGMAAEIACHIADKYGQLEPDIKTAMQAAIDSYDIDGEVKKQTEMAMDGFVRDVVAQVLTHNYELKKQVAARIAAAFAADPCAARKPAAEGEGKG